MTSRLCDPHVDPKTARYIEVKSIYDRCVKRLREMRKNDPNRPNVREMMLLSRAEMEKLAPNLPC
jgi:hypothetical protein